MLSTMLTALIARIFPYDWPWDICLMFGAMMSATDPVAVVALLKGDVQLPWEFHTDPTPTPHRPHADPTLTPHRPHADPAPTPQLPPEPYSSAQTLIKGVYRIKSRAMQRGFPTPFWDWALLYVWGGAVVGGARPPPTTADDGYHGP